MSERNDPGSNRRRMAGDPSIEFVKTRGRYPVDSPRKFESELATAEMNCFRLFDVDEG